LYKILSTFAVLKPPQYGNCSLSDEPCEPLISIPDVKQLYQNSLLDKTSFLKLKEKLALVVDINNKWIFAVLCLVTIIIVLLTLLIALFIAQQDIYAITF